MSKGIDTINSFRGEYEFLSNMYPVRPSGILYIENGYRLRLPTSEHIYASLKLANEQDRLYVRSAETGLRARNRARRLIELGHQTTYETDEEKIPLMKAALEAKFARGTRMASLLAKTDGKYIIEGNNWGDNFWGCSPADNPDGQNNLGILLMEVRTELLDRS